MKHSITLIVLFISLHIFAQTPNGEFDGKNWKAPYTLPFPAGWDVERFPIPIEFAPQIPYTGMEDLRFAPGWAKAGSDEYWTYAFLWYLDGAPETNEKIIEANLKFYYTGLVERNIQSRNIPPEKFSPVKTSVKKIKTDNGDAATYSGTIEMLDYMQQLPITLNCMVHLKTCSGQNKTFLFYQISPKPFTHAVWQPLHELWVGFDCKTSDTTK